MEELWATIPEFPRYSISNFGQVMNNHTGKILSLSVTFQGAVKVTFRERDGFAKEDVVFYTRSVKVLVANAFVHGKTILFNTPISLDGDQLNNHSDNLVWRPRWFAWKYTRQFKNIPYYNTIGPLCDIESGNYYKDIFHASTVNGLLFFDVWQCALYDHKPVFPTEQTFALMSE